ncbi:MAG: response regulator transcription factor [Planctomycetes bacterium]|nr:response regulator transcription factor [Planctomycetota bacterium]
MVVRLPYSWDLSSSDTDAPDVSTAVHVVDDDPGICTSIARVVQRLSPNVHTHESAEQFLAAFAPEYAAVLVLDLGLPGISGLELLRVLRDEQRMLPTLVLSANDDVASIVQSISSGAIDFLAKPPEPEALADAVERLLARAQGFAAERRLIRHLRKCHERLTPREVEVFRLLSRGFSPKQIACELGLQLRTAHIHRANVLAKFQAESSNDLVMIGAKLSGALVAARG